MILHTWPCFPYPYKKRILTWPVHAHHFRVHCARMRFLLLYFRRFECILLRLRKSLLKRCLVECWLLQRLLPLCYLRHLCARLEGRRLHIRRTCISAHAVVRHAAETALLLCQRGSSRGLLHHEVLMPC